MHGPLATLDLWSWAWEPILWFLCSVRVFDEGVWETVSARRNLRQPRCRFICTIFQEFNGEVEAFVRKAALGDSLTEVKNEVSDVLYSAERYSALAPFSPGALCSYVHPSNSWAFFS
jgi:hypothetical protein